MQTRAVRVFRWVERMNNREPDTGEYGDSERDFLPDDAIPDTLVELLQHTAIDFVPETIAAHRTVNAWLDGYDVAPGSECKRYAGDTTFEATGTTINATARPYRFYLLARVQDDFDSLAPTDRSAVEELLTARGMRELLDLRLKRAIGRDNNLEVWLG
jgi:hypothetical protein